MMAQMPKSLAGVTFAASLGSERTVHVIGNEEVGSSNLLISSNKRLFKLK